MPTLAPLRLPRVGDDRLAALAAAGDERAFEAIYDRHHRALLGFCRHMLGTLEEAEDALQQTFLRAHRALAARGAPVDLRPWLYTIARNCCLTMLSARRPVADGEPELADIHGLGEQVQMRAELRAVVGDVERLPDDQRAALVLAELADLSHDQIAEVIGVRPGKVKALIHQARTTLIAEREAREAPCATIREQLSTASGGELRRGPLRRHLRLCDGCRAYRDAVAHQRRALALALPVTPSLGLKAGVLGAASATGGAGAAAVGGTAAVSGGGLAAKLAAGAIIVGGTTAGGIAVVDHPRPSPVRAPAAAHAPAAAPTLPPAASDLPAAAGLSPLAGIHRLSRPATTRSGSRPDRPVPKRSQRQVAPGQGRGHGHGQGQGQAKRSHGQGRPVVKAEPKGKTQGNQQAAAKAKGSLPTQAKKPAAVHTPPPRAAKPPRARPEVPAVQTPDPVPPVVPTVVPDRVKSGKR
jgi:RNA polymerase sigma factor (sigma-70 family)